MPGTCQYHENGQGIVTYSFELIRITNTVCRDHRKPLLPPLLGVDLQHVTGDETWRAVVWVSRYLVEGQMGNSHAVDTSKVHPFDGQRLGQVHDTSL